MRLVNIFTAFQKEMLEKGGVLIIYRKNCTWQFDYFNVFENDKETLILWMQNRLRIDHRAIYINLRYCGLEHMEEEPELLSDATEDFYIKGRFSVYDLIEMLDQGKENLLENGNDLIFNAIDSSYNIFMANLEMSVSCLMEEQTKESYLQFKREFEIISKDFILVIDKLFEGVGE